MQKKRLFCFRGKSVWGENRFSKLTAFLFSFFSFTVALFSREWQVAYRTEMSTIMVTAPATRTHTTRTPHTHTGSTALTTRGVHTHSHLVKHRKSKLLLEECSSLLRGLEACPCMRWRGLTSADCYSVRVCLHSCKRKSKMENEKSKMSTHQKPQPLFMGVGIKHSELVKNRTQLTLKAIHSVVECEQTELWSFLSL